jgi:Lon protease-like protein
MIKRVIETNGLFGVMLPPCASDSVNVVYGTMVRITGFEPLLSCDIVQTCDGNLPRYVVQVSGISRFKIEQIRCSDAGYYEGLATRVEDIDIDSGNWDPRELEILVTRSREFVKSLLISIPETARIHFESKHGQMPLDPSDLSFWLAEFLPLNPYVLYQIMTLDRVSDRLKLLCGWMEATQARAI